MEKWKPTGSVHAGLVIDTTLKEKIRSVQKRRDDQQTQLNVDLRGMTAIERVNCVTSVTEIEGILRGLDIALEILKK